MEQKLSKKTRTESDLIGSREVPESALYGVQTLRGIENFRISKFHLNEYPLFIQALAITKMGATIANRELDLLTEEQADAILRACKEILEGKHHEQFPVDMIQGGAGTTTNMNINEVVANRALELMGHQRGEYQYCSPNDHVNRSQSTNDAYPTAIHIGLYYTHLKLVKHFATLIEAFRKKGAEFAHIIKMGRTQLEDAVPMTLGQTFNGFASILEHELKNLDFAAQDFLTVNMGATAIGTGITAEPEALNVIALKADGGMRDALSIFDQVVSFTGGHISYKSVIENLNVLDYEYYFRLTDHFLANQVSDALLLLNDVLNKGFDASHFVTGLSSHFRDLLVSKDPATLALLEVGASIRERYQSQAQKCPLPFLYRAMKLCNDCDLNYRASKNKRLLVELTLIQVAQLTAEGDDAGDGRGPKQSIKPIFSQPAAAQQPKAANAMPQQQATTAAPAQPRPVQQAPAAQAASLSPEVQQAFSSQTTMRPTPTAVLMAQGKEEKKIPVMKMSGLGVSIKHPRVDEEQQKRTVSTVQQNAQPEEDFIFNEKDVNYYWQEYAGRLPQEQTALAKRMQVIRLTMLDATTFEVVVENDIAAKEFTDLIPTLQGYLRKRLKNSKATMTVRVSAPTEKVRAYSRVEKFQLMAQKNNALLQLKDEFGLELY